MPAIPAPDQDLLVLHQALIRLESLDARAGRVVELRFFGGLKRRRSCRNTRSVQEDSAKGLENGSRLARQPSRTSRERQVRSSSEALLIFCRSTAYYPGLQNVAKFLGFTPCSLRSFRNRKSQEETCQLNRNSFTVFYWLPPCC
jgi:hypothetical protein